MGPRNIIKIGDKVRVRDPGETYPLHSLAFKKLKFKNTVENWFPKNYTLDQIRTSVFTVEDSITQPGPYVREVLYKVVKNDVELLISELGIVKILNNVKII